MIPWLWLRQEDQWSTRLTHLLPCVRPGWWTRWCPHVASCWLHGTQHVVHLDRTWKHGSILPDIPKHTQKQRVVSVKTHLNCHWQITVCTTGRFSPVISVLVWCKCFLHLYQREHTHLNGYTAEHPTAKRKRLLFIKLWRIIVINKFWILCFLATKIKTYLINCKLFR